MAEIDVRTTRQDDDGYAFTVLVDEAGDASTHHVTMSRAEYERLGRGSESPEGFVRDCFRFLLDREPKERILSRFDIREIGSFYPEFAAEITRRR